MKKMIKRVGALSLAAVVLAGSSMAACAAERSYTYNYDYWGDVQNSPDAYTVTKVFASVDFGLDVNMKNPQGLFVKDNTLYVCDTGNNRILQAGENGKRKIRAGAYH